MILHAIPKLLLGTAKKVKKKISGTQYENHCFLALYLQFSLRNRKSLLPASPQHFSFIS